MLSVRCIVLFLLPLFSLLSFLLLSSHLLRSFFFFFGNFFAPPSAFNFSISVSLGFDHQSKGRYRVGENSHIRFYYNELRICRSFVAQRVSIFVHSILSRRSRLHAFPFEMEGRTEGRKKVESLERSRVSLRHAPNFLIPLLISSYTFLYVPNSHFASTLRVHSPLLQPPFFPPLPSNPN